MSARIAEGSEWTPRWSSTDPSPSSAPPSMEWEARSSWGESCRRECCRPVALLLAGSIAHGDTARGIGVVTAGASTGFPVVALALGAGSLKVRLGEAVRRRAAAGA
jgi:hypothetical protein